MHTIILRHSMANNLISPKQWGFLPSRSTSSALLKVTSDWLQLLENKEAVWIVYFDLKKAFDTVPHRLLIDKLRSANLNPYVVQWVFDYLLRRQQRTVVSGSSSSWATVISGVPQGSVLGPLLFILFINDVTNVRLSVNSDLNLYADDMVLYKPVRSAVDATEFQEDINLIAMQLR